MDIDIHRHTSIMMRRDPGPKPPVPPNKPMMKKPSDEVSVKFTDALIDQKKKQVSGVCVFIVQGIH